MRNGVTACALVAIALGGLQATFGAVDATWNSLGGGTFNWNVDTSPPWSTADFPNGAEDIARFAVNITANLAVDLNETITIGSMTVGDTGTGTDRNFTFGTGAGGDGFVFDNAGGDSVIIRHPGAGGNVTINPKVTIAGNGNLNVTSNSGSLFFGGPLVGGDSTNFNYTGTATDLRITGDISGFTGTYNLNLGTTTITFQGLTPESQDGSQAKFNVSTTGGGSLRWGDNSSPLGEARVFKMGSLSGSGNMRNEAGGSPTTLRVGSLSIPTSYSGVIYNGGQSVGTPFGAITSEFLSFEKVGNDSLTLSGANIYQGQTIVKAGTLLVNGSHEGGAAYTVENGGTLGGAGSIISGTGGVNNPNLNAGVTVQAGGSLSPGASLLLPIGTLTFNLGTGTLDLSAATNNSGALKFDLDTPGSSDKVALTSGLLNVGTLDFADFTFSTGGSFGAGTYTLFANSAITGSIGSGSGLISGFLGQLDIIGNDVLLTVTAVPEAGAFALVGVVAVGSILSVSIGKRRRSRVASADGRI